jgi:hypothetical protein
MIQLDESYPLIVKPSLQHVSDDTQKKPGIRSYPTVCTPKKMRQITS